jgi:hypothetical protein
VNGRKLEGKWDSDEFAELVRYGQRNAQSWEKRMMVFDFEENRVGKKKERSKSLAQTQRLKWNWTEMEVTDQNRKNRDEQGNHRKKVHLTLNTLIYFLESVFISLIATIPC